MAKIICFFILVLSTVVYGQNIKGWIDDDNRSKLDKLLLKGGDVFDEIEMTRRWNERESSIEHLHPMHYAAFFGKTSCVQFYVEQQNNFGEEYFPEVLTLSIIASMSMDHQEITQYLYNYSPNPKIQSHIFYNRNALMAAAVFGDEKIYFDLKDRSDLNITTTQGNKLFHLCAQSKNEKIAMDVLNLNITDYNLRNKAGYTALDFAAQKGHTELFKGLLKKGSDINQCKEILRGACEGASTEIYDIVLTEIPDINTFDTGSDQVLPVTIALKNKGYEIVLKLTQLMKKQLKEKNFEQYQKTQFNGHNKDWPFDLAINSKQKEVVECIAGLILFINQNVDPVLHILVPVDQYRMVKNAYGKEYADDLYERFNLHEYE